MFQKVCNRTPLSRNDAKLQKKSDLRNTIGQKFAQSQEKSKDFYVWFLFFTFGSIFGTKKVFSLMGKNCQPVNFYTNEVFEKNNKNILWAWRLAPSGFIVKNALCASTRIVFTAPSRTLSGLAHKRE